MCVYEYDWHVYDEHLTGVDIKLGCHREGQKEINLSIKTSRLREALNELREAFEKEARPIRYRGIPLTAPNVVVLMLKLKGTLNGHVVKAAIEALNSTKHGDGDMGDSEYSSLQEAVQMATGKQFGVMAAHKNQNTA